MRAAGGPCNFIPIIEVPEKNIAISILALYSKIKCGFGAYLRMTC